MLKCDTCTFDFSTRTGGVNGRCVHDHPAGEMMGRIPFFDPKSPSPSTPIPVGIGFSVSFLQRDCPFAICGGFFTNSAPAHSAPTADGVTGAGFALAVGFCPITDRSKTLGRSPRLTQECPNPVDQSLCSSGVWVYFPGNVQ